jgi:hypothetical protein
MAMANQPTPTPFGVKNQVVALRKSVFKASIKKARNGPSTQLIKATSCVVWCKHGWAKKLVNVTFYKFFVCPILFLFKEIMVNDT